MFAIAGFFLPARPAAAVDAPKGIVLEIVSDFRRGVKQRTVFLGWPPVPGATAYKVLRSDTAGAGHVEIGTTPTPGYLDADVQPDPIYHYIIRAVAGAEISADSEEVTVTISGRKRALPAPTWDKVLSQKSIEFGETTFKVGLVWNKIPEALAYNIYRSTTTGKDYLLLGAVPETQFVDTRVEDGKTYFYVLTALDQSFQETEYSEERKITIEKEPLPKRKIRLKIRPRAAKSLWTKTRGDENGRFNYWEPTDISLDEARDTLYAVSNNTQEVYALNASTGAILRSWGSRGTGPGRFLDPIGTGLDKDGNLYVADKGAGKVLSFSAEGKPLREYPLIPPEHVPITGRPAPMDVAVDGDTGDLYISDNTLQRIWVLDRNGNFLRFIGDPQGGPDDFRSLVYLRFNRKGELVVMDLGRTRVLTFTKDGALVREWGQRQYYVGGFLFIGGVGFDAEGNYVITNRSNTYVQGFLPDGRYLYNLWNERADNFICVFIPKDIIIDSRNRAFICEGLVDRISAFQFIGPAPPPQEEEAPTLSMPVTETRKSPNLGPHRRAADTPCKICHDTASGTPALVGYSPPQCDPLSGWGSKFLSHLCYCCHDSSSGIAHDMSANAFDDAHNHGYIARNLPEYPNGQPQPGMTGSGLPYVTSESLECTSCHNVHEVSNRPFNQRTSYQALCDACHSGRVNNDPTTRTTVSAVGGRNYSTHPTNQPLGDQGRAHLFDLAGIAANLKVPTGAPGEGNYALGGHLNGPGGDTGNIDCQTCHAVHGPTQGSTEGVAGYLAISNATPTAVATPFNLCEGCHFGGATGEPVGSGPAAPNTDHPIDNRGGSDFYPLGVALPAVWLNGGPNKDRGPEAFSTQITPGTPVCSSCHDVHGGIAGTPLLRGPNTAVGPDDFSFSYGTWCFVCHTLAQVIPNARHNPDSNRSAAQLLRCGDCHGGNAVPFDQWRAHNGFRGIVIAVKTPR